MVFGIFIDVPLIVGGFAVMYQFRKKLSEEILRVKIPPLVLYLLTTIPLIVVEEDINCMTAWCGAVLIPPTLPFIFVEMLLLGVLVLKVHATNVLRITTVFSVFGLFWEIFLGGLVGGSLLIIAIIGPYVAVSYAFISLLPLNVLLRGKQSTGPTGSVPAPVAPSGFAKLVAESLGFIAPQQRREKVSLPPSQDSQS